MSNTYWNSNGKYEEFKDKVAKYMPSNGYTQNDYMNAYTVMCNVYYDLYNNGLCNFDVHEDAVKEHLSPFETEIQKRLTTPYDFAAVRLGNKNFEAFENVLNTLLEIGMEDSTLFTELEFMFIDSKSFLSQYGLDTAELKERKIPYAKLPLPFNGEKAPIAQHYIGFKDGVTIIDEKLHYDSTSGVIQSEIDLSTARFIWKDWDAEREKVVTVRDYVETLSSFTPYSYGSR